MANVVRKVKSGLIEMPREDFAGWDDDGEVVRLKKEIEEANDKIAAALAKVREVPGLKFHLAQQAGTDHKRVLEIRNALKALQWDLYERKVKISYKNSRAAKRTRPNRVKVPDEVLKHAVHTHRENDPNLPDHKLTRVVMLFLEPKYEVPWQYVKKRLIRLSLIKK